MLGPWLAAAWALPPAAAPAPEPVAATAPVVRPWAAPWDVQARYDAWRAATGRPPAVLACEPLWPEAARLCFRRVEAGRLVRVHLGEAPADALSLGDGRAAEAWVAAELETVAVDGSTQTYQRLRDGEGRAVLGVLRPGVLAERLGVPFLAALPSSGVLIAWAGGDPTLDHVLAVGAREIHDAAADPVSPVVFAWDGARWFPFAEAVREPPVSGP